MQIICVEAVDSCKPFSVMITEESETEVNPRVIAPYFEPSWIGYEHIGCFEIGDEMHIEHWFKFNDHMVPSLCWMQCSKRMMAHESGTKVYNVFVIHKGAYCGCGEHEYGKYGLVAEDKCEVGCLGDFNDMRCGGDTFYSAFEVEKFIPMFLNKHDKPVVRLEQEMLAKRVDPHSGIPAEIEETAPKVQIKETEGGTEANAEETVVAPETVEGRNERQNQEAIERGLENFEFYRSQYPHIQMDADDTRLVLPLQRGFVVDPSATYKIWYGENLRNEDIENNIGESCVEITVELHEHPKSWLDDEVMEYIDDGSGDAFDYNQLFL